MIPLQASPASGSSTWSGSTSDGPSSSPPSAPASGGPPSPRAPASSVPASPPPPDAAIRSVPDSHLFIGFTHQDAASSGTHASSRRAKVGTTSAIPEVTDEPAMPPSELPTAMKEKRRRPWSLSKQSLTKPQKTVTTKSAKTLVQT